MSLLRVIVAVLVANMCLNLPALAQEAKIKRHDLPPAVESTVAAQSRGATIRGFTKEKEKGQTFYEAELMVNGHSKDVLIDGNGEIVEVEEQVALNSLLAPVRDGLLKAGKGGKLVKIESLTKHGNLVAYEAQVVTGGKRSEVQVGPDGRVLDHEE